MRFGACVGADRSPRNGGRREAVVSGDQFHGIRSKAPKTLAICLPTSFAPSRLVTSAGRQGQDFEPAKMLRPSDIMTASPGRSVPSSSIATLLGLVGTCATGKPGSAWCSRTARDLAQVLRGQTA